MRYNFAFYTGNGIGGISAHTIKAYYIPITAQDDIEAIIKLKKKIKGLVRFNDAFAYEKCGVEIHSVKVGCCFINDSIIVWEGKDVLASPQIYELPPYKRKIYNGKYIFDGNWVLQNCWTSIYPSYTSYFNHIWNHFGGNGDIMSLFGNKVTDLKKYYYDVIKATIKNVYHTFEEKEELEKLLTKQI